MPEAINIRLLWSQEIATFQGNSKISRLKNVGKGKVNNLSYPFPGGENQMKYRRTAQKALMGILCLFALSFAAQNTKVTPLITKNGNDRPPRPPS